MSQANNGLRLMLFGNTDGKCWYCGIDLDLDTFHIDHVVPRRHGGTDDLSNLVASCPPCNMSKGANSLEQFRKKRARIESGRPYFNEKQVEWLRGKGFEIPRDTLRYFAFESISEEEVE